MFDQLLVLAVRSARILRVDLDTAEVSEFLTGTGASPDGIAVDDEVYWTTMGVPTVDPDQPDREKARDFSARNGGVHAAGWDGRDWDGTPPRSVTSPGAVTTGKQLAAAGGWLYWSDREGCRVSRIRPDGTGFEDLVVNEPTADGTAQCVGVAVDPADEQLYWTQKGPAKGGLGRIFRVPLSAPRPAPQEAIELLWEQLPEPIDLVLHDGWLYWTDRGAEPTGNTLNRAPVPGPGQGGQTPEILAGGFAEAIGLAVDGEAGVVYVTDLRGRVRVVPLPGSSASERTLADLGEAATGIVGIATRTPSKKESR